MSKIKNEPQPQTHIVQCKSEFEKNERFEVQFRIFKLTKTAAKD